MDDDKWYTEYLQRTGYTEVDFYENVIEQINEAEQRRIEAEQAHNSFDQSMLDFTESMLERYATTYEPTYSDSVTSLLESIGRGLEMELQLIIERRLYIAMYLLCIFTTLIGYTILEWMDYV